MSSLMTDTGKPLLPTEVEIYINPDGSVTFADLEASLVAVARKLDPGSAALAGRSAECPRASRPPED